MELNEFLDETKTINRDEVKSKVYSSIGTIAKGILNEFARGNTPQKRRFSKELHMYEKHIGPADEPMKAIIDESVKMENKVIDALDKKFPQLPDERLEEWKNKDNSEKERKGEPGEKVDIIEASKLKNEEKEEEILKILKKDPSKIEYVDNRTPAMYIETMKQDPNYVFYVDLNNEKKVIDTLSEIEKNYKDFTNEELKNITNASRYLLLAYNDKYKGKDAAKKLIEEMAIYLLKEIEVKE